MKVWSKKHLITVCAIALTMLASAGVTWAYFSDYETALGQATIHLSGQTTIHEEPGDDYKDITIVNTSESTSMVTRVRVFAPADVTVTGDGWTQNGDYWYYNQVLAPGAETTALHAAWSIDPQEGPDSFDVIVAHESAIAVYDANNHVERPSGWDYIPSIAAAE